MFSWIKRLSLFFLLNFCVIATVGFFLKILHLEPYLRFHGIEPSSLFIFCLLWGFTGAFFSLLFSKQMAKWMVGAKNISLETADPKEKALIESVLRLCHRGKLTHIPEIAIFPSDSVNAFATGFSKKNSMVAFSKGLLNHFSSEDIEAIAAHELSHILNGDMVTMTLLQAVVNTFVLFLSRILAFFLTRGQRKERSAPPYLLIYFFEILFMLLGSMLIAAFSRKREFRADRGGAMLTSKSSMISALTSLQQLSPTSFASKKAIAALCISQPKKRGIKALFATHPPLEDRIQALQALTMDCKNEL